jgi:exopolysaccharide biosynthesis polyprenyl glycosylphosphotransferase
MAEEKKFEISERKVLLLLLDSMGLLSGFVCGWWVFGEGSLLSGLIYLYRWTPVIFIVTTLLTFYVLELYNVEKAAKFALVTYLVFAGIVVSTFFNTFLVFLRQVPIPRQFYFSSIILSTLIVGVLRYLYVHLARLPRFHRNLVIVGVGEESRRLVRELNTERPDLNFHVVGFIDDDPGNSNKVFENVPVLGRSSDLLKVVDRNAVDTIVISTYEYTSDELLKTVIACQKEKIKIMDISRKYEMLFKKVPMGVVNELWFVSEMSNGSTKKYFWYAKRVVDIAASLCGICILFSLAPIVAAAIKLTSKGPVFYRQERIGRGGKTFRIAKFRTMVDGAEKDTGPVWSDGENEHRITVIGRVLRRTRLDELPQLVNVLKGQMSIIGPRPERPEFVEMLSREIPFYAERHMVTPGITGWAQVNYPYANCIEDTKEKLEYDFYYLKNRRLLLDLQILLKTIRVMLTGTGAK